MLPTGLDGRETTIYWDLLSHIFWNIHLHMAGNHALLQADSSKELRLLILLPAAKTG